MELEKFHLHKKLKLLKMVTRTIKCSCLFHIQIAFEVAIISKNQDDGLQILEQILPYFQPHYNLSIKLIPSMKETRDVPVILNSIDYDDTYEGDFATRRAIIYTQCSFR